MKTAKPHTCQWGVTVLVSHVIVAAAIEQNHDDRGIIWPESIAPFQVVLIPLKMEKSEAVREAAENLYNELVNNGFDVLIDDRKASPGV